MKFFIEHGLRPKTCLPFGKLIFLCTLLVVVHLGLGLPVLAWEITTHKELTEQAINIKAGFLDTYLKENLGLEGGLGEVVDEKTVRQWMIEGSDFEDNGRRALSHFHDAFNNRGLGIGDGISAIDWSLAAAGAQDGENSYSWNDAREYYFKALTSSTKTERDENWGKTFRALGQIMHLLQDSANPSHVRHDSHPDLSSYIGPLGRIDVDGLHDYMARQSVSSYPGATFFTPDSSLLETAGAVRNEPFSNLFDRDTYNGGNPEATLGTNVGIAEFTNANFFSDDTIPGQNAEAFFPFPTIFELVPAAVPLPYLTLPRLGSPAFPAARAAKLTSNQAAAKFLLTNTHFDLIGKLELDDAVYDAQAQNLIPRAIDYSAAVLDYFFREKVPLYKDKDAYEYVLAQDCVYGPFEEEGALTVSFDIPLDLAFEGEMHLYYDLPGGQRIPGEQWSWDESFRAALSNPGGTLRMDLSANPPWALLDFDQPFRWTIVWDGKLGPEEQERRAIIGQAGMASWSHVCQPL